MEEDKCTKARRNLAALKKENSVAKNKRGKNGYLDEEDAGGLVEEVQVKNDEKIINPMKVAKIIKKRIETLRNRKKLTESREKSNDDDKLEEEE